MSSTPQPFINNVSEQKIANPLVLQTEYNASHQGKNALGGGDGRGKTFCYQV